MDNVKVYFSHSTNLFTEITKYLKKAKEEIIICSYLIDLNLFDPIFEELSKNKVKIKIITDPRNRTISNIFESKYEITKVGFSNGYVNVLMHNKFCVIDHSLVISGTYNFTKPGIYHFETMMYIEDYDLAMEYEKEFKKIKDVDNAILEMQYFAQNNNIIYIKNNNAYLMSYPDFETMIGDSSIEVKKLKVNFDDYFFLGNEDELNFTSKVYKELQAVYSYEIVREHNDDHLGYVRIYINPFTEFKMAKEL